MKDLRDLLVARTFCDDQGVPAIGECLADLINQRDLGPRVGDLGEFGAAVV